MKSFSLATLLLLAACGGDGEPNASPDASPTPSPDARVVDASPAPADAGSGMTLSSSAVIPGQLIADKYTCQGENVSPPLTWTAGPASTQSYAIVFTDLDNGPGGFIHSAIWDIGAGTNALPEHVENVANPPVPAGAKQARGYDGQTFGYLGPCPGRVHHYQFKLYAVDAASLPGVTTQSSLAAVVAALAPHTLATATLDLTSD